NTFFPQRTTRLLQQLRKHAAWWPLDPPVPSHEAGPVPTGLELSFASPKGVVYVTTDGSDPRLPGGAINTSARSVQPGAAALTVDRPTLVRARVYSGSDWSAVVDTYLVPDSIPRASAANLTITEIQY